MMNNNSNSGSHRQDSLEEVSDGNLHHRPTTTPPKNNSTALPPLAYSKVILDAQQQQGKTQTQVTQAHPQLASGAIIAPSGTEVWANGPNARPVTPKSTTSASTQQQQQQANNNMTLKLLSQNALPKNQLNNILNEAVDPSMSSSELIGPGNPFDAHHVQHLNGPSKTSGSKTPIGSGASTTTSSFHHTSRPESESSPGGLSSSVQQHSFEAHVPPKLGVAPLGPCPLPPASVSHLRLLDAASRHTIHPADSQRLR